MKTPLKILIIDDNEDILSAISEYYSKKNYLVTSASDGLEGLKLIKATEDGFDIVLTDLVMPNISGVGVIAFVKKRYPDTVAVALTGWSEHLVALASEAQADCVIRKPISLDRLEKITDELLLKKASPKSAFQHLPARRWA